MEKQAQKRVYSINLKGIRETENWAHKMLKMWNERFNALEELLRAENDKQETNDEQ